MYLLTDMVLPLADLSDNAEPRSRTLDGPASAVSTQNLLGRVRNPPEPPKMNTLYTNWTTNPYMIVLMRIRALGMEHKYRGTVANEAHP